MSATKSFFLHLIETASFLILLLSALISDEKMLRFQPEGKTNEEIVSIIKKEKGKLGMLYFATDWCGPCKLLEKKTFKDDKFIAYVNAYFIPFKVNAEKQTGPELKKKYYVRAYPTVVLINEQGEVIDKVIGYKAPQAYLALLENVVEGKQTLLTLKRSYEKDPNNKRVAIQYARNLFKYNESNSAKLIYEKYLETEKSKENLAEVYFNLATIYKEEGNTEKTAVLLEEGLKKSYFIEIKERVHFILADIYFQNENFARAIDHYKMISKDTEYYYTAQTHMAISYFKISKEEEGGDLLNELFSQAVAVADVSKLNTLLWLCLNMKVYRDEALKWNKIAVELTNWQKDYLINSYALLLLENGKRREAITTIKKAIEIASEEDSMNVFKRNLVIIYWIDGNQRAADEIFADLFERAKNDANKLNDLAWSCREYMVNLESALDWAKRAVELSGKKIDYILNTYANLLFDNGNYKEAIEIQKKALEITTSKSRKIEYKKNIEKYEKSL